MHFGYGKTYRHTLRYFGGGGAFLSFFVAFAAAFVPLARMNVWEPFWMVFNNRGQLRSMLLMLTIQKYEIIRVIYVLK